MAIKIIPTHDIEANWVKWSNAIITKGQIIIYDPDDNCSYPRIKIGDGVTPISSLPFVTTAAIEDYFDYNTTEDTIHFDGGRIT